MEILDHKTKVVVSVVAVSDILIVACSMLVDLALRTNGIQQT